MLKQAFLQSQLQLIDKQINIKNKIINKKVINYGS